MSGKCPYCPPFDSGWGGSDEMYAELQRQHYAKHCCRHGFTDPDGVCKNNFNEDHISRPLTS